MKSSRFHPLHAVSGRASNPQATQVHACVIKYCETQETPQKPRCYFSVTLRSPSHSPPPCWLIHKKLLHEKREKGAAALLKPHQIWVSAWLNPWETWRWATDELTRFPCRWISATCPYVPLPSQTLFVSTEHGAWLMAASSLQSPGGLSRQSAVRCHLVVFTGSSAEQVLVLRITEMMDPFLLFHLLVNVKPVCSLTAWCCRTALSELLTLLQQML